MTEKYFGFHPSHSSFSKTVPLAGSVSVLQVLRFWQPEERAPLWGEGLAWRVLMPYRPHWDTESYISVETVTFSRKLLPCSAGLWSSPLGGAGIWPNRWWISSSSAIEVHARSSFLGGQRPALLCWAGTRLHGSRYLLPPRGTILKTFPQWWKSCGWINHSVSCMVKPGYSVYFWIYVGKI